MPAERVAVLEAGEKLLIGELTLEVTLCILNISEVLGCLLPRDADDGGCENLSSCWSGYLVTKHDQRNTRDTSEEEESQRNLQEPLSFLAALCFWP